MSDATFSQSQQLHKIIGDKRISKEHLQAILESGLLSDLLSTHPGRIDREAFRALIGKRDAETFLADIQLVHDNDSRHKLLHALEHAGVNVEDDARVALEKHAVMGPWLGRFRLVRIDAKEVGHINVESDEEFLHELRGFAASRGYAFCPQTAAAEFAKSALNKPKKSAKTRLSFVSEGMKFRRRDWDYDGALFDLCTNNGKWDLTVNDGIHGDLVFVDTVPTSARRSR